MNITAIRHGQTEENIRSVVQGHSPGVLSELGKHQAEILGHNLASEHFDYIFSSDLQRCKDTAAAIIQQHPQTDIEYVYALREVSLKGFEGQLLTSIPWEQFGGTLLSRRTPDGESWESVRERVVDFLNDLYSKHPDANVLLVTHNGPLRIMKSIFNHQDLASIVDEVIPNCSVWKWQMHAPIVL